jgi:hypothetical protein
MKTFLIVGIAVLCFLQFAGADDKRPEPAEVVVRVLNEQMPHEESKRTGFLWNTFANKPEEKKFNSYSTKNWKENFVVFAKTLVQKAGDQKLDSQSLRKALDLVLEQPKNKTAYLPVGAYQTTLDSNPIWIITVKWESWSDPESTLGHIRIFAFDQRTLKQVAFATCM